jgi:hypothetical protein
VRTLNLIKNVLVRPLTKALISTPLEIYFSTAELQFKERKGRNVNEKIKDFSSSRMSRRVRFFEPCLSDVEETSISVI